MVAFVGGFGAFVERVSVGWRTGAFVGVPAYVPSAVLAGESFED